MKTSPRHFKFLTLGMAVVLVVGYVLLAAVVWFSADINAIFEPTSTIHAADNSIVMSSSELSPTDYVQTILNNPENLRNTTIETSPALRRASGEQIFLMGF